MTNKSTFSCEYSFSLYIYLSSDKSNKVEEIQINICKHDTDLKVLCTWQGKWKWKNEHDDECFSKKENHVVFLFIQHQCE